MIEQKQKKPRNYADSSRGIRYIAHHFQVYVRARSHMRAHWEWDRLAHLTTDGKTPLCGKLIHSTEQAFEMTYPPTYGDAPMKVCGECIRLKKTIARKGT